MSGAANLDCRMTITAVQVCVLQRTLGERRGQRRFLARTAWPRKTLSHILAQDTVHVHVRGNTFAHMCLRTTGPSLALFLSLLHIKRAKISLLAVHAAGADLTQV